MFGACYARSSAAARQPGAARAAGMCSADVVTLAARVDVFGATFSPVPVHAPLVLLRSTCFSKR